MLDLFLAGSNLWSVKYKLSRIGSNWLKYNKTNKKIVLGLKSQIYKSAPTLTVSDVLSLLLSDDTVSELEDDRLLCRPNVYLSPSDIDFIRFLLQERKRDPSPVDSDAGSSSKLVRSASSSVASVHPPPAVAVIMTWMERCK